MKNNLQYTLLIGALCLFLFTSCKKKNEENTPSESMTALINGQPFTATSVSASILAVQGEGRRIDIYGQNGSFSLGLAGEDAIVGATITPNTTYKQLDLNLDGEDDFTPESNGLFTYAEKNAYGGYTYPFTYARGEFTITAVDTKNKTISGTFSFRTDDYDYMNPNNNANATIVEITSGEFKNVKYTYTEY